MTRPTPAPEYILGSESYYSWRAEDFRSRFGHLQIPEYYLDYGDKYVQRFKNHTRPLLSEAGQCWLDRVLLALQEFMEDKLMELPSIELNAEDFNSFAFDSHVQAYRAAGFENLPWQDLLIIAFTPDISDLFKLSGRKQMIDLWREYAADHVNIPILRGLFRRTG